MLSTTLHAILAFPWEQVALWACACSGAACAFFVAAGVVNSRFRTVDVDLSFGADMAPDLQGAGFAIFPPEMAGPDFTVDADSAPIGARILHFPGAPVRILGPLDAPAEAQPAKDELEALQLLLARAAADVAGGKR